MLRGLRFKLTVVILKLLGWKAHRGRDSKGRPYIAFMLRDGTKSTWLHAHVYVHNLPLDSTLQIP